MTAVTKPAAAAQVPSTANGRLIAAVLGVSFLGLAVWFADQIFEHAESPVYPIPPSGKEVVLLGVIAIAVAASASVLLPRGWLIFLFAFSLLLIFFGVLLTLIGIPLIALGAGLFALAVVGVSKIRWSHRLAIMILGTAVAFSMGQLVIARSQTPLVECMEHGVRSGESNFYLGGGGHTSETGTGEATFSGSATTQPGGESTGTITSNGKTYSYVCRDGELVELTSSG